MVNPVDSGRTTGPPLGSSRNLYWPIKLLVWALMQTPLFQTSLLMGDGWFPRRGQRKWYNSTSFSLHLLLHGLKAFGLQEASLDIVFSLGCSSWIDALPETASGAGVSRRMLFACSATRSLKLEITYTFTAPSALQYGRKLGGDVTLLCWQSSIYWIWQERNKRLHNQQFRSPEAIISLITRQITDRISAYRLDSPAISSIIMQLWFSTQTWPDLSLSFPLGGLGSLSVLLLWVQMG